MGHLHFDSTWYCSTCPVRFNNGAVSSADRQRSVRCRPSAWEVTEKMIPAGNPCELSSPLHCDDAEQSGTQQCSEFFCVCFLSFRTLKVWFAGHASWHYSLYFYQITFKVRYFYSNRVLNTSQRSCLDFGCTSPKVFWAPFSTCYPRTQNDQYHASWSESGRSNPKLFFLLFSCLNAFFSKRAWH